MLLLLLESSAPWLLSTSLMASNFALLSQGRLFFSDNVGVDWIALKIKEQVLQVHVHRLVWLKGLMWLHGWVTVQREADFYPFWTQRSLIHFSELHLQVQFWFLCVFLLLMRRWEQFLGYLGQTTWFGDGKNLTVRLFCMKWSLESNLAYRGRPWQTGQ